MFTLQRLTVELIELENTDGSVVTHQEEHWKTLCQRETKLAIREYIEEKYIKKGKSGTFRMIAPGNLISNPMNIRLQGQPKKVITYKEQQAASRERYRLTNDLEPIIFPNDPKGRMRLVARAMREV